MVIRFGSFELDRDRFELRRDGEPVPVEPKVLGLMLLLAEERHRAVDKRELLAKNWPDAVVGEASLTRAVMEARKALGDDAHEQIVTVRGRGFRFAAEVQPAPALSSALARTTLIGRGAALTLAQARLIAASAGNGGALWITGEAGIGKSALADELARLGRERGFEVLRARCHEAEGAPKLWPWTQLARAAEDLLPETALDGLRPFAEGEGKAEFSGFDAFARDLVGLGVRAPLVVILEDVHWMDEASIQMLGFVARELSNARVLLACTYRDVAPQSGPRGDALTSAVHGSGGASLPLRPLAREDVAELIERTTGSVPKAELVTWMLQRSVGNPLYLRELLAAKGTDPVAPPTHPNATSLSTDLTDGLRRSIEKHLDALSAACRETLTLAALFGQRFDLAALAAASGLTSEAVLERLSEAARARMVERSTSGAYGFRHPLVRSVLSRGLPGVERARAHASIAKALSAHWKGAEDAHAEALAHHYVRALPLGDPRRAADCSVRAAEAASTRGDHARSASHYEHALEALRHLRGDDELGVTLLLALARAREKVSPERAREAYLDAAVLARALHAHDSLAAAALGFASLTPEPQVARDLIDQAIAAFGARPPQSARAALGELAEARAKLVG